MRYLFIVSFLYISSLPAQAMNRWAPSENLDYPETIRSNRVVGTAENFSDYQGTDFSLSTENIHYLKTNPLQFIDSKEIQVGSGDGNVLLVKDNIEMVEMSQMKILYPENSKTSLVTFHVFPCVAITAYNKTHKIIGMAHIPGSTRDNLLNFEENPMKKPSTMGNEKIEDRILSTAIDQFLAKVNHTAHKDDLHIQLFGGHKNRELLLKTAQYITDFNYSINIQDIHWAHEGYREKHFQMNTLTSFDILMKNDGQVHIIKDNALFVEKFIDSLDSLENETLKQGGYPWLLDEWKKEESTLMDKYLNSVTDPGYYKKFDQFKNLYIQTVGEEENIIS